MAVYKMFQKTERKTFIQSRIALFAKVAYVLWEIRISNNLCAVIWLSKYVASPIWWFFIKDYKLIKV